MSQRTPLVLVSGQQQQLQSGDYADIGVPYFMHKNRLLNGDFNVWQRGTALTDITASGTIYADRWMHYFDGSGVDIQARQQLFTPGQTEVPDNPRYYYECSIPSVVPSGQTRNWLTQRIEGVNTFAGQPITVSLWAKADASRPFGWSVNQSFGTGGSPSSLVQTAGTTFSLTTTWTKYSHTLTLPGISGKTLGTNGDDYLELYFILPLGTTFTIDLAHVQLEYGQNATQFEYRPRSQELAMCQRYFAICGAGSAGGFFSSTGFLCNVIVPVSMRASPTISLTTTSPTVLQPGTATYTGSGSTCGWNDSGATIPANGSTTGLAFINGFSGATTFRPSYLDGNFLKLSAEL